MNTIKYEKHQGSIVTTTLWNRNDRNKMALKSPTSVLLELSIVMNQIDLLFNDYLLSEIE